MRPQVYLSALSVVLAFFRAFGTDRISPQLFLRNANGISRPSAFLKRRSLHNPQKSSLPCFSVPVAASSVNYTMLSEEPEDVNSGVFFSEFEGKPDTLSITSSDDGEAMSETSSERLRLESPLVYRYYGRQQARTHSAGFPFVILCRNVDHCKATAQELAARGFSVIVCERVQSEEYQHERMDLSIDESSSLIRELLDALRWNRAVLVGIDCEATITVQAAMRLAPERVAGIVFCGDMKKVSEIVQHQRIRKLPLEHVLQTALQCPFTIIGEGTSSIAQDSDSWESPETSKKTRYTILGGGTAPHQRRPELFAWCLTRFVEERIAPKITLARGGQQQHEPPKTIVQLNHHLSSGSVRFRLRDVFAPGSFVVSGRIVAAVIFYVAMVKVLLFQYDNFHDGMINFNTKLQFVASLPRRSLRLVASTLASIGSLFARFCKAGRNDEIETEADASTRALETKPADDEARDPSSDKSEPPAGESSEKPPPKPCFLLDNVIA